MHFSSRFLGLAVVACLAAVPSGAALAQPDETTPETDETVPGQPGAQVAPAGAAGEAAAEVAGETAAGAAGETAGEDAGGAEQAVPGVEGPLYVVTPDLPAEDDPQDVVEIYQHSDQTFLTVLWWWVLLILALAAVGAGAWYVWGRRRRPRRPSGP